MRVYKPTRVTKRGKTVEYGFWYCEFRDNDQNVRRLKLFADHDNSVAFARNLERLLACQVSGMSPDRDLSRWIAHLLDRHRERLTEWGFIESDRAAAGKELAKHLADWKNDLLAKGVTAKQARQQHARATAVIEGCGFDRWKHINAVAVQDYLARRRNAPKDKGAISTRTSNFNLQAVKQFCRWMVRERRAIDSPVAHLSALNPRADITFRRRALTADEARKLIDTARKGEAVSGMPGPDRALLYMLTLETGLRWSELYSLKVASFALSNGRPSVTVEAAYSKHRREDQLPLRAAMADAMKVYLAGRAPSDRAFPTMPKTRGAEMLAEDLKKAKIKDWNAADGKVDFHSLRHTFVSNLATSGVHPKVAQTLARHSTITLTMDVYTHVALESQVQALENLPDLTAETGAQQRKDVG